VIEYCLPECYSSRHEGDQILVLMLGPILAILVIVGFAAWWITSKDKRTWQAPHDKMKPLDGKIARITRMPEKSGIQQVFITFPTGNGEGKWIPINPDGRDRMGRQYKLNFAPDRYPFKKGFKIPDGKDAYDLFMWAEPVD
jgi:hypothetical protein